MRRSRFLRIAGVALAGGLVAGCSSVTGGLKGMVDKALNFVTFKGQPLSWRQVVIAAADGANQNSATAVDIVLVFEETALDKITPLSAAKWFPARADMLRTFPGTFAYYNWEVSPSQTLRVKGDVFGNKSVAGVFVFADYLTPGEHRMRVEQLQDGIIIELGARGFSVSPYKGD